MTTHNNGQNPPIPTRDELEAAGIRIAVGLPLARVIPSTVTIYLWEIARRGWPLLESGYGRIDVNRNRLADRLMESDYTHLMMLDTDELHPPDIIERHARWVMEHPERLVIGGVHYRRGTPFDPMVFLLGDDGQMRVPLTWPDTLIECAALGHGSLLVSRQVFERLQKPYWGYDYGQVAQDRYPSEDMYFCHMCRASGIKIYADMTATSGHLFETVIDEEVFRHYLKANEEQFKDKEIET